jgi:hypothetical protein
MYNKYPHLLSPLRIGNVVLKNSLNMKTARLKTICASSLRLFTSTIPRHR